MKTFLRALELSDVEKLVKWRNDLEITTPLGGNTFFISKFKEEDWLKKTIINDEKNIKLAICLVENGEHIGNVNLTSINWINRSAEYSIMIGDKDHWGKGYGHEATFLILKYAFEELNLQRIYLTVRSDNIKAFKLYQKIGFQQEGILRKSLFKNNHYIDMHIMSMLKNEFSGTI
jgi:diamine N-acetyltransferase